MTSDKFQPSVELTDEDLGQFVFDDQIMRKLGATTMSGSEAIDGSPNTSWGARIGGRGPAVDPYAAMMGGQEDPNALIVDFPKPVAMRGFVAMNRQNDRNRQGDIENYSLMASDDGKTWTEVKSGKLESIWDPQTVLFDKTISTRHLKLVAKSVYGPKTAPALAEFAVLYAGPKLSGVAAPATEYSGARGTTAEVDEGVSVPVNASNATSALVQSISSDNALESNPVANVLDGKTDTYWLTGKGDDSPACPHWIKLRFRQPVTMTGFEMTPRQGNGAAMPRQFTLSVSEDGKTWKDAMASDFEAKFARQAVSFKNPVTASYVKLTIRSNFDDKPPVAISELSIAAGQK
jgi:hypothetical protein